MLPLRMLGPLMLMILLCDADSTCPSELNPLTLHPPEVIGEYKKRVSVNCTSTVEDHIGMYWRQTAEPDSDMEEESNFIFGTILLSDWNVMAECKIKLNDSHECSKHLEITVYRNPEMVTMFSTNYKNTAVEGTQYELQCDIISVAPIQNLIVTWYKDNQTIKIDSFTNTKKTEGDESSTLKFNISRGENGAQFRCEAQLDFGPHGSQPPVSSETHQVSVVHYAPELKNKTDIDDVFVNEGNDVTLNCEAEGNPPPVFHWTCDGVNIVENRNNLNISRVHTNANYSCTASNYLGNITKQIYVRVIKTSTAPPAMITPEASTPRGCPLTLSPDEIVVRFGDPASVNCSTSATNVEGMGWEAAIGGTMFEAPPAVTWTVEKLEEWTIKPQCYVTMKDNYQCSLNPAITLYKTPDIVSVSGLDHGPMVEGTEYQLNCSIINVAPVQKLKVNWYRGNEIVYTETFNDTSVVPLNVFSSLRVTPKRNYNAALFRCEAELHLGSKGPELVPKAASSPYIAVVLYKPQLKCSGHNTGVEHKFSLDKLSCQADGNPLPTVQWYYQGEPINASEPLSRTHSGMYTVDAVNSLGRSSTSVNITVEYGPSFTCNDHHEIEEDGKFQTKCEPEGIPKPTISWFKDGKEMPSPHRWTKHDSGKYLLKATNKHGTANQTIYVDVLYAPVFKKGNYIKEAIPGENVTFDCLAEGNPLPVMRWNYTSAINVRETTGRRQVNISVTGATSTNAGVYICVASNGIGHVTRSVTLMMKDKTVTDLSPLIWGLLIVLVIIVILTMIILRNHWKKHGQYSFVPGTARDGSDIPMTTQSDGVHA